MYTYISIDLPSSCYHSLKTSVSAECIPFVSNVLVLENLDFFSHLQAERSGDQIIFNTLLFQPVAFFQPIRIAHLPKLYVSY